MLNSHYKHQVMQMYRVGNTIIFTLKEQGEDVYQPRRNDVGITPECEYYIQYELTPDGCKQHGISSLPLKLPPHCSPERKWGAVKGNLRKI
jgi:hypothetical protein